MSSNYITSKETNTLDWVFVAKGIGILLVVAGHFHPKPSPTYWNNTISIIYSFHMPLFFLLSGYLYKNGKYPYKQLLIKKIKRLVYPFISIALLFFTIKYIVGKLAHLDHPVNTTSLYYLITDPVHSYMPLLWFVYALFIIFIIYPLLRSVLSNFIILLILLTYIIFFGTDILILGKSIFNMPFFIIGILLQEKNVADSTITSTIFKNIFFAPFIFAICYIIRIQCDFINTHNYLFSFILGTSGAVFIVNISKLIVTSAQKKLVTMFTSLGSYSMTIYLFHTLFESTVRIIFIKKLSSVTVPFEVVAIIAILAGIIFPLLLEKMAFRKYLFTRKFLLGMR